MANYNQDFNMNGGNMNRQTDLVLAVNEYAHVQNTSTGEIRTHVGPCVVTISQQETLVVLNARTKRFEKTSDYSVAKQLFTSAPEGWYVVLKNPVGENAHPAGGGIRPTPEGMKVGEKINIPGPVSFALFPGQMARVLRGHKLRSNQYLLARVYDADAANKNAAKATVLGAEGNPIEQKQDYFAGQLLVIKGTEISFYIPPTGIEVVARDDNANEYVRDAVTLERLEYAILKDENGEKTYSHGPAVVFPSPTQTFVTAPKGGVIFRALELSSISGIYIKVIAEYADKDKDGKTVKHPIGEELFITGNDQMIYYPRPEHAMIQYDGKYMHHAIAIPEGEGRYILDRLTGAIKTVKGPAMYLPDPRKEVVVKRKLTAKECELYYPGNREVLEYNLGLSERTMEQRANRGQVKNITDAINDAYSTSNQEATLAIFEANSNIARGVSYTKPRTITLDTKYDGVVAINVWTGYAVNVVSKSGKRDIIVGPATRLLDYDETLEMVNLSTGKPKTTDRLINTAYLRVDNNKVSDFVDIQTKDFVNVRLRLSYCVDFLPEHKDKWFSVDNYVKYLCDRMRSLLKREAKEYDIEEFYARATDIVRGVALNKPAGAENADRAHNGRFFRENGMLVTDVEVLGIEIEKNVAMLLEQHQNEMIRKTLELSDAEKKAKTVEQLAAYEKKEADLRHSAKMHALELSQKAALEDLENKAEIAAKKRAEDQAQAQAKADIQKLLDLVHAAELARDRKADDEKLATEQKLAEIEKAKEAAYAETVAKIMQSIAPGLIEAMNANANVELTKGLATAVSPYAMANGESVADTVSRILRGSPIEEAIKNIGALKQD